MTKPVLSYLILEIHLQIYNKNRCSVGKLDIIFFSFNREYVVPVRMSSTGHVILIIFS